MEKLLILVFSSSQSFFHVDCFKCAKCHQQVTADTNLLLLSDGSPICSNCSYSCNVCHLPILDEAIMTGDDSYHAHCFKCKVCKNRIDELVFAKTSQGIYCMDCHNARVAKSRRHAQRQKERQEAAARAAAAGAAGPAGGSAPVSRQPSANGTAYQNGVSRVELSNRTMLTILTRMGRRTSLLGFPHSVPAMILLPVWVREMDQALDQETIPLHAQEMWHRRLYLHI